MKCFGNKLSRRSMLTVGAAGSQTLGTRVRLGLEGFWKRYEGLETAPDIASFGTQFHRPCSPLPEPRT